MADPDLLALLVRSVAEWNSWRHNNPRLRPDLSGAELSGRDLCGADLTDAFLADVRLVGTKLDGADLSGAFIGGAVLANVDLSAVKGLERLAPSPPYSVSVDSLTRSRGLPLVFIENMGIPASLVATFGRFLGALDQYESCFLSYASLNATFAEYIHHRLEGAGVRTWFAPPHMRAGDSVGSTLVEQIDKHDRFLVVLSREALDSRWVATEANHALTLVQSGRQRFIVPVHLDEAPTDGSPTAEVPEWCRRIREETHIVDFSGWQHGGSFEQKFAQLLSGLRRLGAES